MNIEIKKLTPQLVEDYLQFFDETPHSTNREEHRCYCVCWAGDNCDGKDFSTAEKRRIIAAEYVKTGAIKGYLAYFDKKVIGWCNANTKSDCYECISWKRFNNSIKTDGLNIKSIFCFAVAPKYRGKGVAKKLLEAVCDDAKAEGFDYIEGYPNKAFLNTEDDFMGPIKIYREFEFNDCYETEDKVVMRKKL